MVLVYCKKEGLYMKFIKPKSKNKQKVEFRLSQRTRLLIGYYSKYTEHTEDDVVDLFMANLLEDKDFVEWLNSRRSKEKISNIIFSEEDGSEEVV
jgi:hypothetical protein